MPASKSRAPTTSWNFTVSSNSRMEVRTHNNGICYGLPRTKNQHDVIWTIVDRRTKSSHFLAIKMTNAFVKLSWLYIRLIILLHGVLVSIVSDRDPRFVSRFWESTEGYGYFEFQYCLSPTIRWTIKTHNSDIRRHVESLCFGFQGKLGWPYPLLNLPTTIIIIRPSVWHLLKHYMGASVGHRFVGTS